MMSRSQRPLKNPIRSARSHLAPSALKKMTGAQGESSSARACLPEPAWGVQKPVVSDRRSSQAVNYPLRPQLGKR